MFHRNARLYLKNTANQVRASAKDGGVMIFLCLASACGTLDTEGKNIRITDIIPPSVCTKMADLKASHRFCSPVLSHDNKCSTNRMRNEAGRIGATHLYFEGSNIDAARGVAFKCPDFYSSRSLKEDRKSL